MVSLKDSGRCGSKALQKIASNLSFLALPGSLLSFLPGVDSAFWGAFRHVRH